MALNLRAFISYQTDDRAIAGELQRRLDVVGIQSFLAHEDIEVSDEWRSTLLRELSLVDIFICLLSKRYLQSQWCVQESGIAAFRKNLTIIPLSIDGTIPQGFMSNIQSAKVDPDQISLHDLIPAFLKRDFSSGIDLVIELIGTSRNYSSAEANFALLMPHISKLSPKQAQVLLQYCIDKDQVHDAGLCARDYIPAAIKMYPHALVETDMEFLRTNSRRRGVNI